MMHYEQQWIEKLDEIIEQNINNPEFVLADLVKAIATSPAQLNRRVNKLTGLSPRMYIRHKRLTRAKELLEIGMYPIVKEVALAVGYQHTSYFSTIFYEKFNKRPIEYLEK